MSVVPAPWSLKGRGIVIVFKIATEFAQENSFVDKDIISLCKGGWGTLMLVDYHESAVGAYQELLFVPGKIDTEEGFKFHISKIYVDSLDSQESGIQNWGIPKEIAEFEWKVEKRKEFITVKAGGKPFFTLQTKRWGFKFPIKSSLIDFSLAQKRNGKLYCTSPVSKGKAQMTHIISYDINPEYFPEVFNNILVTAFTVDPFEMTFAPAIVSEWK